MVADQLKNFTQTTHQQLEKLLIGKMKEIKSSKDYVQILQLFYGYFGGLEDQINKFISPNQVPDYTSRRKTNAIAKDITDFGGVTVEKAGQNNLPQINNQLQAFGALYVIEGSTLGGSHISQMIARRLNLDQHKGGFTFFNGYGSETMAKWETFKEILNNQTAGDKEKNAIYEAANDTFVKFKNWIEDNGR